MKNFNKVFYITAIILLLILIIVPNCLADTFKSTDWHTYKHEWYYENYIKDSYEKEVVTEQYTDEGLALNPTPVIYEYKYITDFNGNTYSAKIDTRTNTVVQCKMYGNAGESDIPYYNELLKDVPADYVFNGENFYNTRY